MPPRLPPPPQGSKAPAVIGRAADSFSRIVSQLRDAADTAEGTDSAGRRAAWISDLSSNVQSLRALQKQVEPDRLIGESESQRWASEALDRRVNEIIASSQQRLDSLLTALDAKDSALQEVTNRANQAEAELATAQRLHQETSKREHARRLELRAAVDNRRYAEARLAACEVELENLKTAHNALLKKSTLAMYIRTPNVAEGTALDMAAVDGSKPNKLVAWAERAKLGHVLAAAVQRHLLDKQYGKAAADADVALAFLKGLESREAVAELVSTPAVADALAGVVWQSVQQLQQ